MQAFDGFQLIQHRQTSRWTNKINNLQMLFFIDFTTDAIFFLNANLADFSRSISSKNRNYTLLKIVFHFFIFSQSFSKFSQKMFTLDLSKYTSHFNG